MNTKIVLGVVAAVVIAGGSFYGGSVYGQSQSAATASAARTSGFAGARTGRAGAGGGFTSGTVVSVNGTSMTIKMQSGSTQIVLFGTSTQIMKSASGTPADFKTGSNVIITGAANSDGSLTAQSIQIR